MEQALNSPGPDAFVMPDAVGDQPDRQFGVDWLSAGKHGATAAGVQVEIFQGQFSAAFDRHWNNLLSRADVPNVFMHPGVLRAAGARAAADGFACLGKGPGRKASRRACGLSRSANRICRCFRSALCARRRPIMLTCRRRLSIATISTPTLHAMLDAIAEAPDLPKFVALESMSGEGRTYEALIRVLQERQSRFCRLDAKSARCLSPAPNRKAIWKRRCPLPAARNCVNIGAGSARRVGWKPSLFDGGGRAAHLRGFFEA